MDLPSALFEGENRCFPGNFAIGTATSAYQIEGAHKEDGKGLSIWDVYSHTPGKISNSHTGDVACDHYHKFKEDIQLLSDLGIKHYRFSIAWTRILPTGRYEVGRGEPNKAGIDFYNKLIDELLAKGIQPYVTLYHWDLPQDLYKEYGGWLSPKIINDYVQYAVLCFKLFGDRVKMWLTFNEPWCIAVMGYGTGEQAPGHSDKPGEEPYVVAHHILLAHATAVRAFRTMAFIGSQIGLTLNANWWEPVTNSTDDFTASRRALSFSLGWFADPVYFGDYPQVMKDTVGARLPSFTIEQKQLLKGSVDFLGINHYTTLYCGVPSGQRFWSNFKSVLMMTPTGIEGLAVMWNVMTKPTHHYNDLNVMVFAKEGMPCTDMAWIVAPFGIRKLLEYCYDRYKDGIYIFENGCAVREKCLEDSLNDKARVSYLHDYITEMHKAMVNGVDVKGYFAWSTWDNMEWNSGYTKRFGLIHVDYETQKRTPKSSAHWYSRLCKTLTIPE